VRKSSLTFICVLFNNNYLFVHLNHDEVFKYHKKHIKTEASWDREWDWGSIVDDLSYVTHCILAETELVLSLAQRIVKIDMGRVFDL